MTDAKFLVVQVLSGIGGILLGVLLITSKWWRKHVG